MIVRAKLKVIEDIPEWGVCCPAMRTSIEEQKNKIVEVDTSTSHRETSRCYFCKREVPDRAVMCLETPEKLSDSGFTVSIIFVDLFDLDEGPSR